MLPTTIAIGGLARPSQVKNFCEVSQPILKMLNVTMGAGYVPENKSAKHKNS